MVLKIEIPTNVLLSEGDEIVIKFTGEKACTSILHAVDSVEEKNEASLLYDSCGHLEEQAEDNEKSPKAEKSSPPLLIDFVKSLRKKFKQQKKYRLMETYASAMNSFLKFTKNSEVTLEEIDAKMIGDYECHLRQSGLTLNTVSFYMRILRSIYNKAVCEKMIADKKPFAKAFTKNAKTAKRAITVGMIKKIANAEVSNKTEELARDLFLFSYYTRGMSFVDISFLKKTDISNAYLIYKRKKTGQELKIAWRKEMQDLVDKHSSLDGVHLLSILDLKKSESLRKQYHYKQCLINNGLKRLAKRLKLDVNLTMYVARHSWATIARQKNVPISVICDSMGHNSEKTTQIYLKSVDADVIDRYNAKLIKDIAKPQKVYLCRQNVEKAS